MSSKAKKVVCVIFEPQLFRKNLCKNCFKTKDEHGQSEAGDKEKKDAPKKLPGKSAEKSTNDVKVKQSNDKTQPEPQKGLKEPGRQSETSGSISNKSVKPGTGIGHLADSTTTRPKSTGIKQPNVKQNDISSGHGADVGLLKTDPPEEARQAKISEGNQTPPNQQHSRPGATDETPAQVDVTPTVSTVTADQRGTSEETGDTPGTDTSDVPPAVPPRHHSPSPPAERSAPETDCHSENTSTECSSTREVESGYNTGQSTPECNTSLVWSSSHDQQQIIDTDTEAQLAQLTRGNSSSSPVEEALTVDDLENDHGDWYISHHAPQYTNSTTDYNTSNNGGSGRNVFLIRRSLAQDDSEPSSRVRRRSRSRMDSFASDVGRDEAMMEGTRMLMENLREKVALLEDKCDKLEREKKALADLMTVRKDESTETEERLRNKIDKLDDACIKLESENGRLLDIMKLPETDRKKLKDQDNEMHELRKKLEETEGKSVDLLDDNVGLREEIKNLHLEMEEMHDQFREEEALEFREIQKDLEATAKNCRILQFKLRKSERRNDILEAEKMATEEKMRVIEERQGNPSGTQHIRELEEELRMAKEVSVRLHDELEIVEERRARYEEELERVQDYLHESENRRSTLQREKNSLHQELEDLRDELVQSKTNGTTLKIPERKPKLTKEGSREGSIDYDIEQVMRDLAASVERENDVKEQLKYAQEENKVQRKKISDLEEESESLNMQVEKLSTGVNFRPKTGGKEETSENDLRMELELAEDELKVLRRKIDEAEQENENLRIDMKLLESTMNDKRDKENMKNWDKSHEEKFKAMSQDIEDLKWKLIEKDREVESLKTSEKKKGTLQKSKSVEGDSEDLSKKLDSSIQEMVSLKEKLSNLEKDNERLNKENKTFRMMPGAKIPSIKTDDAAVQNIDLKDKLKLLETENELLRTKVNTLDEKLEKLSKEVTQARSRGSFQEESNEARDLREQLAHLEDECRQLRKRVTELESENNRLTRELNKYKKPDTQKAKKEKANLANATREELKNKITELEDEIGDMGSIVRSREDENSHMEKEIQSYRNDLGKMRGAFQVREKELLDELESTQQKNDILSNLLDLVTERAESTQRELERYAGEEGNTRSERVNSEVSTVSDVSTGSDDVFTHKEETTEKSAKPALQNWEEQFLKRIECLERLLAEERQKVQAAEKKMEVKDCAKSSALTDDAKLHQREKNLIQQELVTCQKQLAATKEELKEAKEKMEKMEKNGNGAKDKTVKKTTSMPVKEPASWKWEKQDMERQIKDYKKKLDDLQKQPMSRKSITVTDDKQKNDTSSKEMKQTKDENKKLKKELEDAKKSLSQAEETLSKKEKQWQREKDKFETSKSSLEKENKKMDDIIKQRDELTKSKDKLTKEKAELIKNKDEEVKKATATLQKTKKELEEKEEEFKKLKDTVKQKDKDVKDVDAKVKKLEDDLRTRDERLKEKDDLMSGLNKTVKEKETKIADMDKKCAKLTKDAERQLSRVNELETKLTDSGKEAKNLRMKASELEAKFERAEKDYSKQLGDTVINREKLEYQLARSSKECKEAQEKVSELNEKLQAKNKDKDKEIGKVELQLKQANEKIHSLEMSKTMKRGDAMQTLTKEKELLISEKHKLSEDIKKLRKESQDSSKAWKTEREDMQSVIAEKTKLLAESNASCERTQKEIDKLKTQKGKVGQQSDKSHSESSSSWEKEREELLVRIDRQEAFYKAEKASLEELYEGKLQLFNEQLAQAKSESQALQKDKSTQKQLLEKSNNNVSAVQEKYDGSLSEWKENKANLQKKIKTLEDKAATSDKLQKQIDDLQLKLKERDASATEMKVKHSKEKSEWDGQKLELQAKLSKGEQGSSSSSSSTSSTPTPAPAPTPASSGPRSRIQEMQSKFQQSSSKFGPTKPSAIKDKEKDKEKEKEKDKKDTSKTTPVTDKEKAELKKQLTDAKSQIKEWQTKASESEKAREKEHKEMMTRVESLKKEFDSETKEMNRKNNKLEEKVSELDKVKSSLLDLQVKVQKEREQWLDERGSLSQKVDDTKKSHLDDQEKMKELSAEVKKLRALAPVLDTAMSDSEDTDTIRRRGEKFQRQLSSDKHKVMTTIELAKPGPGSKKSPRASLSPGPGESEEVTKALDEQGRSKSPSPGLYSRVSTFTLQSGAKAYIKITRRSSVQSDNED